MLELIQCLRNLVEYLYPEELQLPHKYCGMGNRQNSVFQIPTNLIVVLKALDNGTYDTYIKTSLFRTYVTSAMGDGNGCFLGINDDEYSFITKLVNGSSTYRLEIPDDVVESRTISSTLRYDYV